MLIRFYKSSQPVALFTIPIVSGLLCAGAYFFNSNFFPDVNFPMPFWLIVSAIPFFKLPLTTLVLLWILISFQGIYLNRIIIKQEVLYKPSNLPGFIYVCVAGLLPAFIGFHPVIFVNTIMLFVADKILRLYKHVSPLTINYDIGLWISVASFFYLPSIAFALFFFISLSILRPFIWREWITATLGFVTPWFFLGVASLLSDSFSITELFLSGNVQLLFVLRSAYASSVIVVASVVSAFLLLSLLKLRLNFYKNIIRMRNYQLIFLLWLVIALAISIIVYEKSLFIFSLPAVPASVFISYYFLTLKKPWYFETLFILFAASVIYGYIFSS